MWRNINGHDMEIQVYREMGGGIEEVALWCHSCDPTGASTWNYPCRDQGLRKALVLARSQAEEHASEE